MEHYKLTAVALALSLALAGCTDDTATDAAAGPEVEMTGEEAVNTAPETREDQAPEAGENLLLAESDLPYGMPPFDRIGSEDFLPALEQGMAEHTAEIAAIVANSEAPTFENTIVAMERSGPTLRRVSSTFFNLVGANTNDVLQETRREVAPKLAAHQDAIFLNEDLFARIDTIYQAREELDLDPQARRLVERYHQDFVRAGAALADEQKVRLKEINGQLAELGAQFSEQVLAEVNDSAVLVDSVDALAGLSESAIGSARDAAADAGHEDQYLITLLNTSGQPPLSNLSNRQLRERVHTASLTRGGRGGEHDVRQIVSDVIRLRTERARMLGYESHADYVMEVQTAGSVAAVNQRLTELAPIARRNAEREAEQLQAAINAAEDESFELASWDWAYYAEKVRKAEYDVDEDAVKPYFELNNVLKNGVFFAAEKLFGITFTERPDLPVYHPDVQIYEVFEADGSPLGLFIADWYARPSKRGGAWMNSYVIKSGLIGGQPVVGNHLNITKPPAGEPTLMTWDEVTTMFHEFGHAIHGLFSDVEYPYFAATAVPRDFVEYPSQVFEMWADWPEVLENYALHHETGEPIPAELLERVLEAQKFNEGFRTFEYLAAAMLDQTWHQITDPGQVPSADGVLEFEARALADAGMDFAPVPPRYRTTYFSHIMGGYSAGYYSYIWSEVLDADSVEWFKENGGLTRENGDHFRNTILSSGGSIDAMELYRQFAGRDADIQPLLERRGLVDN